MNEELNNGTNNQPEEKDKLEQTVKKAGEQVANEIKRKSAKLLSEAAKKLATSVITLIITNIGLIAIVVAVIVVISSVFAIFDYIIDGDVSETTDEVTNQAIIEYCEIGENGINFNKEQFISTLPQKIKEEIGIGLNDLGFGKILDENGNIDPNSQAAQYLYKYIGASLSSELPYIEGSEDETKGIIKIKRKEKEDDNSEIELKYIPYNQFQSMINSDERDIKEQSLRYFSLDPSWNLCVTKWQRTSKNGIEESYEVSEVKIPYKKMISGYTVPFLFLIDLQLTSFNANYVEAVANLVKQQSFIDFTIFDSVTTDETTYTYEATKHTKTKNEGNTIEEYTITKEEIGPEVTVTTIETDSIKANVTKAKTWIIDQEITYNLQESREYPYGQEPGEVKESSESEPEGEGTWYDPKKETTYEEIIKREWVKGATETKFMPNEFLGLWSNKTGKYVKGAPYVPEGEGKLVEYKVLDESRMEKPITNILINQETLYDLLESKQATQTHSEMMKEIISFYLTGEKLVSNMYVQFIDSFDPFEYNETAIGKGNVHETRYSKEQFIKIVKSYRPPNKASDKTKVLYQTGYEKYFVQFAEDFYDIATSYNLSPEFIFCIGIHESEYGTSRIIIDKNNPFGYGAVDGNAYNAAHIFPSMKEAIEQECYDLSNNFLNPSSWKYKNIVEKGYNPDTIDGIGSLYASDGGWARKVKNYMQTIFGYDILGDEIVGEDAQAVVELAKKQVGKDYIWGADGPDAFDCSGLVKWVYQQAARINIPHGTRYYPMTFWGKQRSLSELKPGDILWRFGHTGIYIGDGLCVEAKGKKWGVVISEVSKKGFTHAFYVFK